MGVYVLCLKRSGRIDGCGFGYTECEVFDS